MGQYYVIVNLDKQQFLSPYTFNDGAKLLEFGSSSCSTLTALAVLLADGNNRGGGDLHSDHQIIGSWSGDRIVICGDYADEDKFLEKDQIAKYLMLIDEHQAEHPNLYAYVKKFFRDVSKKVLAVMLEDNYIYETYEKSDLYGEAQKVFKQMQKKKEMEKQKREQLEREKAEKEKSMLKVTTKQAA